MQALWTFFFFDGFYSHISNCIDYFGAGLMDLHITCMRRVSKDATGFFYFWVEISGMLSFPSRGFEF
jgi:hypothetical protein